MEFSHSPPSVLETLGAWWPVLLLHGLVLGIGIVRLVRRPIASPFSLRGSSDETEDA